MVTKLAAEIFRDYSTDGVIASGAHEPEKPEIRAWGAELEAHLDAQMIGGGFMYATLSALNADLAKAAGTGAWVYADATAANNGVYRKIGASGSGSWTRATDLPYSVIPLSVIGGTANAIEVSSAVPVPQAQRTAIFLLKPTAPNTDAVTLIINGAPSVPLRWLNGTDLSPGHLQANIVVALYKDAADYRLTQDSAAAGYAAAAAGSALAAEASAAAAEESADRVSLGDLDAAVTTATTQAGIATTGAATATLQADIATTQASNAAASALSAADSALASSAATPIYPDIATGRAAVADNAQFRVGTATTDISVYTRTSSTTQTLVTTLPGAATINLLMGGYGDRFTEGSGTISPSVYKAFIFTSGTQYIIDVLAKAGERGRLNIFTNLAPGFNITVDLTAGYAEGNGYTSTPLVDGWYFIRILFTPSASGSYNLQLRMASSTGATTYTGDGSSGLWVAECWVRSSYQGASLLAGHTDFTGWTKTSTTVTADAVSAAGVREMSLQAASEASRLAALLDGGAPVTRVTEGSGSGSPAMYRSYGWVSGTAYFFDVIAKAEQRYRLNLFCNIGALFNVTFNLADGTVESGTGGSIEPRGNGSYRCRVSVTAAATAAGNAQVRIYGASGGHPYSGDGASGLLIESAEIRTSDAGPNLVTVPVSAFTLQNCTATLNAATSTGLISNVYEALSGALAGASTHPLAGRKVTLVGTSLVAQNIMPPAFAAATGATVQALGTSGGALGLDARGSPHYGSGAVTALLPSINADAEVIILDMLPNDLAASDVPLGSITDTTTATYYGALANFFIWCETNRPNARVAVVVLTSAASTHSPGDYTHGTANANGNTLEDFQNATRRAALYYGRPFIDPSALGISFQDMGDHTSDGLHWDSSGAVRIAKVLAAETRRFAQAGWLD